MVHGAGATARAVRTSRESRKRGRAHYSIQSRVAARSRHGETLGQCTYVYDRVVRLTRVTGSRPHRRPLRVFWDPVGRQTGASTRPVPMFRHFKSYLPSVLITGHDQALLATCRVDRSLEYMRYRPHADISGSSLCSYIASVSTGLHTRPDSWQAP